MVPPGNLPVRSRSMLACSSAKPATVLLAALTILVALTAPLTASAQSSNAAISALRPFEAVYNTTALGMTLDLTRSLTRDGDNYRLESSGKNFLIKMNESADFRLTDSGIEGVRFTSKVKTLKTNNRAVEFDKELGVIKSMKRGEWSEHPLEPGVLDQFSQQQQLRLTLMQSDVPPETLQFRVVDGAKISDKSWRRLPNDTLQTPLGNIEAVHYQAVHKNRKARFRDLVSAKPRLSND